MSIAVHGWPQRHRITVEHFYRMADAGLFDADERVELVNGEIIDMPPMGSRHATTIEQLTTELLNALGGRAIVRSQLPLRLGEFSEPLPDIAVVRARSDHYLAGHPSADEVWLVIEVSDSTLAYDREVKAALYANHGVTELWVIDLAQLQLLRYRKPADGRYTSAETLPMSRVPVAGTGIEIDLGTLAIAQTS